MVHTLPMKISARPACPVCGAREPLEIVYGLLAGPFDWLERDHAVMGGCMVEDERWQCERCEHVWA